MAEMTKQANFRLSVAHVEIIGRLAAMGRMTKAAVVERALELLERHVAAGEHIPETPPATETRQANFRLRIRHVEIINSLSMREYVTKATVVERALELLDAEMSGGEEGAPAPAAHAMTSAPADTIVGNTAVDLSLVEANHAAATPMHVVPDVQPLHEVRPAAALDQLANPSAAVSVGATASAMGETPAGFATDDEERRRKAALEEKELRDRLRAEAEEEADERVRKAIEEMRSSLLREAYEQAEADAQNRIEAARQQAEEEAQSRIESARQQAEASALASYQERIDAERDRLRAELEADADSRVNEARAEAEASAQASYRKKISAERDRLRAELEADAKNRIDAAKAQAQAEVQASADAKAARAEAEASALEMRLNAQIDALRQGLETKEAQISALRGQLDSGRGSSRLDERIDSLIKQLQENELNREMRRPAHMAAEAPAPDPRIDSILRQLEDQRESTRGALSDARMESLIGRFEQVLRDMTPKPASVPTPAEHGSSSDEIVKILQALNLSGAVQGAGTYSNVPSSEAISRQIAEAREAGREEALRQARSESDKLVEEARRSGYEAGQRDAQRDIESALDDARTEGAFRERAKIANMRGLVFGEKRRYLKVHVTM